MNELKFNKDIYELGNGSFLVLLSQLTAFGFIAGLYLLFEDKSILSSQETLLLSLITLPFPIVVFLRISHRRRVQYNILWYDENRIVYINETDISQYIYSISKIKTINKNRFYYEITGKVKVQEIFKGVDIEKKKVKSIKIPVAYEGMDKMFENFMEAKEK